MESSTENPEVNVRLDLSLDQYDTLVESIAKAAALVNILSSTKDIDLISNNVMRDYLWVLHDIIYQAQKLCDTLKPQPLRGGNA